MEVLAQNMQESTELTCLKSLPGEATGLSAPGDEKGEDIRFGTRGSNYCNFYPYTLTVWHGTAVGQFRP